MTTFRELFTPKEDPADVVVDFANSRVYGHGGLEAIDNLAERYTKLGKTLHLVHLSPECKALLKRAGSLVEVNVVEDPTYHLAVDEAPQIPVVQTATAGAEGPVG